MKPHTTQVTAQIAEVERRLATALAALNDNPNMPIKRARAIAATTSSIFQALMIEAKHAALNQEQQ